MKRLIILTLMFLMVAGSCYAKQITLKATNTLPEDHPMTMALRYMSAEIEKRTNGEVKMDVYSQQSVGRQQRDG